MTTVLSPSGVELPDPGDPHSRAQVNRDFTKINDLWTASVKQALGLLAQTINSTSSPGIVGTETVFDTIASIGVKANRKYRIVYRLNDVNPTVANSAYGLNFKWAQTTDTGVTGTAIDSFTLWTAPTAGSGKDQMREVVYIPAADGNFKILVTGNTIAGGGSLTINTRKLYIYDEGLQF